MSYTDWLKKQTDNWIFPDEPNLDWDGESLDIQLEEDEDEEED
jgi:hypothetical protein